MFIRSTLRNMGEVNGSEWRREMISKVQLISLALLVCVLLVWGCGSPGKSQAVREPKVDKIPLTPSEMKKARLLQQIEDRFESPNAHFELGQLYQDDGLWTQAANEYNIAVSFNPAHRSAQAALVKVLTAGGNASKAALTADIFMSQVAGDATNSLRLAMAFQKQGLDEYAMGCYRQALYLAPNSSTITRQIGYYHLNKGNTIQAQEYLSRSFQLNPNQPDVAAELGKLGIAVKIPRNPAKNIKKLDNMVNKAG